MESGLRVLHKTYHQIGASLNIDPITVCGIVALFDETREVSKLKYPENPGTRKLTGTDKLITLELVIETPGIDLHEIKRQLVESTGTEVHTSTICKFLRESGFTRK